MLTDSVDIRPGGYWYALRPDTLSTKESNTYHVLDSLSQSLKLENKVSAIGKISIGKLGLGFFDLEINRLLVYNPYEGTRPGLGLSTNDKISRFYSVGAWSGYGLSDHRWKYGAAGTVYPAGEKDDWLKLAYQDNEQSAGDIHIHADIDQEGFRSWLLEEVDRIRQYDFTGHAQRGYWEIELEGLQENLQSLDDSIFHFAGKGFNSYQIDEAAIGFKYAYAERRAPVFGYYIPYATAYPVVYFRMGYGNIRSGSYRADYIRSLVALTYSRHFNRWGNDRVQLEAGMIRTMDGKALPRSILLAGKGFRNDYFNYSAYGGFQTMRPYDYFSDRYISLFYRHSFDKFLWQTGFSKPYISVAYNMLYGGLTSENRMSNPGLAAPANGYHESGILLNQLISVNYLHLANIYLNAGLFYHWNTAVIWNENLLEVAGLSIGF
jgi:hypothetical protein